MLKPEIQAILKSRGLPISGLKDVLEERLNASNLQLGWAELAAEFDIFSDIITPINEPQSAWFADLAKGGPVVRRIPKAARIHACKGLTEVISQVNIDPNDRTKWENMAKFPKACFQKPRRAGKKKANLPSNIRKRIESFQKGTLGETQPPSSIKSSQSSLKTQVSAKLQMFDIKGAVRIASSSDVVLKPSAEVLAKLKLKHPSPPPGMAKPVAPNQDLECISCTREDVRSAIQSFPNGSGAGIMGLYPQHLKDLTSKELGVDGDNLLDALKDFLNLIVFSGKVPDEATSTFYGAVLMALSKSDDSVRPIAIGLTLRRLAAKVIMAKLRSKCQDLFQPIQLGVGTPRGCEIAVHALRKWLESPNVEERVLLKIDFRNAFNCIRRDKLLELVLSHTPQIYSFVYQAYSKASYLFFGEKDIIMSEMGVQQGDPCGPYLFSLAILNLTHQMKSQGNIWYLDDGTLLGTMKSISEDFETIKSASTSLGLEVNPGKCELMVVDQLSQENTALLTKFCSENPEMRLIGNEDLTLLGSPVLPETIEKVLRSKLESLKLMANRLESLDAHDAMFLLKNCFALPKLTYFLRTSPCFLKEEVLKEYDKTIQTSLQSILNIKLEGNSATQSSLPVRLGGLGVRSAWDISVPAFLSSVSGTSNDVNLVLPNLDPNTVNNHFNDAIQLWFNKMGPNSVLPSSQSSQASWDLPLCQKIYDDLLVSAISKSDKARLKAVASPHSSDWLNAVPVPSLGLKLDDKSIRVACGLRLGCPLCHIHNCTCGKRVDPNGYHGLSCRMSYGRHSRHDHVNRLIKEALGSAEITSRLEPTGTSKLDKKRPDGISYYPYKNGRCLAWDYTCPDTLAISHVKKSTSKEAGKAASLAEDKKLKKYRHLNNDYYVVPVAIETLGSYGPYALDFIKDIGRRIKESTGEKRATSYLMQTIGIAIQRGNSQCILSTVKDSRKMDEVYYL